MTDLNTTFDIVVLGDVDVDQRLDMLSEKAAAHGAVITQTFAFPVGAAAQSDDLAEVEAVVDALGHALATRTSIWMPWWHQDLCRESHLRRLGLTLQRHGLDLLIGQNLQPCPVEGGINEIDSALRNEVRAVYALDDAAMAAAGMHALGPEIEAALAHAAPQPELADSRQLLFDTAEVCVFLDRSRSWVSRGLRDGIFAYVDGTVVEPLRAAKGGQRRFTVSMVQAMAWSAYRRGSLSSVKLQTVLNALSRALR